MPIRPSPAVVRACDLLDALAVEPERRYSVSDLARTVGVPRATCDAVLLALADGGLVARDEQRRYSLGPRCIALADAARASNTALRAAAIRAQALARAESAVVAVSTRDGDQTWVADVYDFGPAFGLRTRAGDAIELVPPFGAAFVAWDDDRGVQRWLDRAEPPLSPAEQGRYRAALEAVRRRGYSVSIASDRAVDLAQALDRLARHPHGDDAIAIRDRAIRDIAHGEYLAAEIDPESTTRLTQISAPIIEPGGRVSTAIMLLGPSHEVTAAETARLGELVRGAAARASTDIGGTARGGR